MTSKNDITGDAIKTKGTSKAYSDGWDRIFKKKDPLEEMVKINEELGLYDLDYDGYWIDPPSGWQYGFPKQFSVQEHKTFKDFLIMSGYPIEQLEFAIQNIRVWK